MIHSAALLAADTDGPGTPWELGFVLGILTLAAVFVLYLIRTAVTVYRTRIAAGHEEGLRELVTKLAATEERNAVALERAEAQLADLSQRFTSLERVLKEVE